ncbi:MAG: endonuclease/exonuclease/phosphatase family protein, partial [Spirochaetia bacterium]|nr:endonuclease/exonuclease/phosphatase family protein [Spirochaetia bacterium]
EMKLKIMSYNVYACNGRDGKTSPERISRVIAMHNSDIIALQEIDVSNHMHQAKTAADLLPANFYYGSNSMLKTGSHGNVILSRFAMKLIKRGSRPCLVNTVYTGKNGVLRVEIKAHGRKIQVFNTQLSPFAPEGMMQAKYLTGRKWPGAPGASDPLIMCGDFNAHSNSGIYDFLKEHLTGIHFQASGKRRQEANMDGFSPGLVDHIFVGKGVKAGNIKKTLTALEKTASDHLPLIAGLMVKKLIKSLAVSPIPGAQQQLP